MSHAYSYGHLTYYTAWLKANYQNEFYCSIISCEDNLDSQRIYMEDARNHGIQILPPDINESDLTFGLNRNNDIIYGLSGIKGVGSSAIDQILSLRPFTSLSDFLLKAHLLGTKINKKIIDALIMSGAVDCFGYKRSVVMRSYNKFILDFDPKLTLKKECAAAKSITKNVEKEIKEFSKKEAEYFNDPLFKEFSLLEILDAEKALIGVHISGNPMDIVSKMVQEKIFTSKEIERAMEIKGSFAGPVICAVANVRKLKTKTGSEMAFIEGVDHKGNPIRMTAFANVFAPNRDSFVVGKYLQCYLTAKPSYKKDGSIDCIVNSVIDLSASALEAAKEEKVSKIKEAYISLDGIPSTVRFKSVINKINSIKSDSKYDDGSNVFVIIKNNKNDYVNYDGSLLKNDSEIKFGPFYTEPLTVDSIRTLNEIPEVTIFTR